MKLNYTPTVVERGGEGHSRRREGEGQRGLCDHVEVTSSLRRYILFPLRFHTLPALQNRGIPHILGCLRT